MASTIKLNYYHKALASIVTIWNIVIYDRNMFIILLA